MVVAVTTESMGVTLSPVSEPDPQKRRVGGDRLGCKCTERSVWNL